MKTCSLVGTVLLALALGGCGNHGTADVQAAWDEFKAASLSNQGNVAANRTTKATHEYYGEIRDLALKATGAEISQMSLAKQITVLGMRVRIEPARLKEMSGRDLFVHAVDKGWIGKNSAADEGITEIVVTGDYAIAKATKAGKPVGPNYHFVKEDGVWRVDMMQMLKFANVAIDAMQEKSGLTEKEFVTRVIETVASKRLTENDWNAK